MTRFYRTGAVGAAILATAGISSAAHADSVQANASVEVLKPLTLAKGADLDFGAIVVDAAGGDVKLGFDGDGAKELTCATDFVCTDETSLARFDVSDGTAGKTVSVELPSADGELTLVGATNPTTAQRIDLSNWETDAVATTLNGVTSYSIALDASGAGSFQVGGTLGFDGSEEPGDYSTTFAVTVDYN